ncbi:hypothetical protein JW948_10295 [bacterium]|nr:hypothetical protein [bacterium]
MKRKEFLNSICLSGACACSASMLLAQDTGSAAENEKPKEDWRIGFSKTRYTKLMEILQSKLTEEEFSEIIQLLGRACSASIGFIQTYAGDPDGYLKELKRRWNENSVYDRENGVITVSSEERTECVCPLIDTAKVSHKVCDCSLGWQKQTFETVLGKKVDVEIKESIIRGGKKCTFEIRILA